MTGGHTSRLCVRDPGHGFLLIVSIHESLSSINLSDPRQQIKNSTHQISTSFLSDAAIADYEMNLRNIETYFKFSNGRSQDQLRLRENMNRVFENKIQC